jgi:CRP/FNR family transcriptional regulator
VLDDIEIEQDLSETYVLRLSALGKQRSLERGEYLYYQGDAANHVYVLRCGVAKVTQSDPDGHETLLKYHGPQSLLGLSALRPRAVRDANCAAVEAITVAGFNRSQFIELLRSDAEFGLVLVRVLLKRQQQLHARVAEVIGHSVEQRLARVLLQLSGEAELRTKSLNGAQLPVTHQELATLVLSRRQYVTAILRGFVEADLIECRRGSIRVVDRQGLRAIVSGEAV